MWITIGCSMIASLLYPSLKGINMQSRFPVVWACSLHSLLGKRNWPVQRKPLSPKCWSSCCCCSHCPSPGSQASLEMTENIMTEENGTDSHMKTWQKVYSKYHTGKKIINVSKCEGHLISFPCQWRKKKIIPSFWLFSTVFLDHFQYSLILW